MMKNKKRVMGLVLLLALLMTGFTYATDEVSEEWGSRMGLGRYFQSMKEFMMERFEVEEGSFENGCPMSEMSEEEINALQEEALSYRVESLQEQYIKGEISEEERDQLTERLEDGAFRFDGEGPHRGMDHRMGLERKENRSEEEGERRGLGHRGGNKR